MIPPNVLDNKLKPSQILVVLINNSSIMQERVQYEKSTIILFKVEQEREAKWPTPTSISYRLKFTILNGVICFHGDNVIHF